MTLTMQQRADAYAASSYGQRFSESIPRVGREQGRDVLYAIWVIGNDYRNPSKYYGAYPKGYLDRLMALFPDAGTSVLHVFSGSLPPGPYVRCDSHQPSDLNCNVMDLPMVLKSKPKFRLGCADPPYSTPDAAKYGTQMIVRGKVTRALASVIRIGGHLAWLDTAWPMHSKTQWVTVGRIFIQRSTNHRVRLLSIFERVDGAA